MGQVDRRQFLQKAGVATAAAGVVWVAPSVLGSSSAWAAGSCIHTGAMAWTSFGANALASNPAATVTGTAQITGTGGAPNIHVVVTITPVGSPGNGNADGVDVGTPFNGYASFLKLSMTNDALAEGYDVKFDFFSGTTGTTPINVYNLKFRIIDIDRNVGSGGNGFNDSVVLTPGFGINSQGTEISGNGTAATPWIGTGTGGVTDDTGTVEVQWPTHTAPVSTVTTNYRSIGLLNDVQSIAFGDLSWCY